MTFSYDPSLADDISKVRDTIRDTVEAFADFPDETLQAYLDVTGSVSGASAQAAWRLYLDYAKAADVAEADDIRIENKTKSDTFKEIYEELKQEAQKDKAKASGKAPMFFGGLDRSTFNSNREDSTLVNPDFTKDSIFFNKKFPETTPLDYEECW